MNTKRLIEHYAQNATLLNFPTADITPRGIILLVHGMCERKERYQHVLDILTKNGFICAVSDLRGHGERVTSSGELGYFGKHGDKAFVEDLHKSVSHLKDDFPNLPFILLGHSMGALIVRSYIKKYPDQIDLLVVCGCPASNPAAGFGKILITCLAAIKSWHYKSKLIRNLVSGRFDKPFKAEGVENSWLSTDSSVAEKYNTDELCGFTFTLNGYYCLLGLMQDVYSKKGWNIARPDLPIHFISGGDDPCRINDNKFYKAVHALEDVGYRCVTSNLYKGRRHELLNETNHNEIIDDIIQFIDTYI